ncbi:MAG: DinB family protein [Pirellulaceae bacterium]|nr:DinB family protein [Pirellulaceae bacterium]
MPADPRLAAAIAQIQFARQYTLSLLVDMDDACWFDQPPGVPTHLAWQVGHLAMAEYGLTLFRQRGRQPADTDLMSGRFRKLFSRGSVPQTDAALYPAPAEIRAVLERVHEQSLREMPGFTTEHLDQPMDEPYAVTPTRLGGLYFCAAHEMLHAGQIGLLRRALGKQPIR